jgi:hypothetical protein
MAHGFSRIPNRRSTPNHPKATNDRSDFGRLEGDSMDFWTQILPNLTIIERQTRFALAAEHLDWTAEAESAAHIPWQRGPSKTSTEGSGEPCPAISRWRVWPRRTGTPLSGYTIPRLTNA